MGVHELLQSLMKKKYLLLSELRFLSTIKVQLQALCRQFYNASINLITFSLKCKDDVNKKGVYCTFIRFYEASSPAWNEPKCRHFY